MAFAAVRGCTAWLVLLVWGLEGSHASSQWERGGWLASDQWCSPGLSRLQPDADWQGLERAGSSCQRACATACGGQCGSLCQGAATLAEPVPETLDQRGRKVQQHLANKTRQWREYQEQLRATHTNRTPKDWMQRFARFKSRRSSCWR